MIILKGVKQFNSNINDHQFQKGTSLRDIHTTPTFILGVLVFVFGLSVNIDSDRRLRNLRSDNSSTGYKIPQGGFFNYVSAANYFGEICEWWGFALAAR